MEKRRRLTPAERRAVYDKMGGRCAYCGEQLNYEDKQDLKDRFKRLVR